MKIIGLRIVKYIDKTISGHNCNFTYEDAEFEMHILCGVLSDNRKVEIELSQSEGECGSGWCTASYGHISVREVSKFIYSYVPKQLLVLDDIEPGFDRDISNHVFDITEYGEDDYYPSGYYHVNMDLFKETVRAKNLRPVWIFIGPSNSGKSFLASKVIDLEVYETDSNETLPEKITAQIIVLGNKYDFNCDQIISKLFGEVEVNLVRFN